MDAGELARRGIEAAMAMVLAHPQEKDEQLRSGG